MPERECFTSEARYYATALHELTHWTGHEIRLGRDFSGRFGSEAYAFEELIAELGSAFLAGHIGFVDTTIENHAAYLQSWLKVLRSDKSAIFTAASAASKNPKYPIISAKLTDTLTRSHAIHHQRVRF